MQEQQLHPIMSVCSNADVPAAPEHNMGDFIQAFAAFVGNGPDENPGVGVGQETAKTDQRPLDAIPSSLSVQPAVIVGSIVEELLAAPFEEATNAVQSILDEVISNVPLLAIIPPSPTPALAITVVAPPPPRLPATPVRVVRGKVQPPTQPPPDRPGRMTNQLFYIKRKVMPAIWAHKFTWPFKKPVDAIKLGIPDYHTIIKQPMDFGTIRKRLTQKYYWSGSECQDDIRLVFWNCFTYNKPELDISIMGRTLEKEVEALLKRMPAEEIGEESMKAAVKRKGRPPGERRRSHYDGDHVSKKARTLTEGSNDFEDDIPVAQVGGTHMGAYGLAPPGKSTNKRRGFSSDESDSEDDDESGSGSEFDDIETARAPGARPSNHRPVPVPRTFQDERPGGLLTERKTIKNYCKYCDQAFLSKYVRDMHEKVKHGSGYVSAEKPKKMPVIKKPKKEPKSLQILPVKTEAAMSPVPVQSFNEQSVASAQFSDHDLLNFVDKKHQAMNKQAKKNQSKKDLVEHQNNIRIPDDMLFPVPEELLLKQGYMHNSSAPPPGYPHGNGSVNGLEQAALARNQIAMASKPAAPNLQIPTPVAAAKVAARAPRTSRGGKAPSLAKPQSLQQPPLGLASPTPDSKYDLQKELGFMEPTFTKSALVTPAGQQPRVVAPSANQQQQQVYLGHPNGPSPVIRHQVVRGPRPTMQPSNNGPTHEALMMARNAMRHQQAGVVHQRSPIVINSQNNPSLASYSSPTPQHVQQRSSSLGYEGLRSPEMQLAPSPQSVHRSSIEERSPGPFLPQQQRPAVIQENSYRPTLAAVLNKPSTSQSIISRSISYTSPPPVVPPQQQAPRPIALESRSVIFPSKPLPKEELKQVQVMQGTPTVPSFSRPTPTTKPADDLLAQTLQLSEIDGFDFTEEKDMPNLVSTQEITLGDLKHLRTETVTIPGAQVVRGGQVKQLPIVTNGQDQKLEDLLDFSNITYQDVRQLIGPTENMIVYPDADGSYSEVIATGSQQTVMLQAQPISAAGRPVAQVVTGQQSQAITFSSTQSFTLQSNPSLTTSTSMPTFTTDLVYPDMGSLEPGTVYATIPEQKREKREEKWWA